MGTTLAVAVFDGDSVALGHVGDSRIYRLRDDQLALLTRDDSLVREAVDQGVINAAEAAASHNRSLVTQALGVAPSIEANLRCVDAREGDVYLVCSDGLSDLVAHDDIELIVNTLKINLPLAARTLVETAKDNGGYDNVSVVLARVSGASSVKRRGWLARVLMRLTGRR
jgi:protein phosphatase